MLNKIVKKIKARVRAVALLSGLSTDNDFNDYADFYIWRTEDKAVKDLEFKRAQLSREVKRLEREAQRLADMCTTYHKPHITRVS